MYSHKGDYHLIKSEYNGKVMHVAGSGGPGSIVVVNRQTGAPNQLWKLEAAENGWFFIVSALSPDLVLEVVGEQDILQLVVSAVSGSGGIIRVRVSAKKYPNFFTQLFRFDDQFIISRATGNVLDIEGGNQNDGVSIISWPRKYPAISANQRWKLCETAGWNPDLPYAMSLDGYTQTVRIIGTPKLQADRFCVNFLRGSDILFHFNPRFRQDGGVTVRNSKIAGQCWEREERAARLFPFTAGQKFELCIRCCLNGFKVEVNGADYVTYDHRYAPMKVDSIKIEGDLSVDFVEMK